MLIGCSPAEPISSSALCLKFTKINLKYHQLFFATLPKDSDFHNYYDAVSELQGYAVEVRYPNETIYLSNEKVEKALMIAKNVRDLVMLKINIKIEYNDVIDK